MAQPFDERETWAERRAREEGEAGGSGRSGVTMGQQRGQAWQDAAPQTDQRAGPQIGSRRRGQ